MESRRNGPQLSSRHDDDDDDVRPSVRPSVRPCLVWAPQLKSESHRKTKIVCTFARAGVTNVPKFLSRNG